MRAQTPLCRCSALLWRGAGARVLGWGSGELCGLAGTALAPLDTRQGEALAAVGAVALAAGQAAVSAPRL